MNKNFNIINSPREDGIFEFYTDTGTQSFKSIQCVHCSMHWQYIPGSGRQRGWCTSCNGVLCGKEICLRSCVPAEAQLELYEGNKQAILKYGNTEVGRKILAEVESTKRYEEYLNTKKDIEKFEKKGGVLIG